MKKYKVGLVGIGAVGTEMVKILRERNFPIEELRVLARSERDEVIAGETLHVVKAEPEALDGLDFAFFAGTEGAKGASQVLGWEAVKRGAIVIDNDPARPNGCHYRIIVINNHISDFVHICSSKTFLVKRMR